MTLACKEKKKEKNVHNRNYATVLGNRRFHITHGGKSGVGGGGGGRRKKKEEEEQNEKEEEKTEEKTKKI